MVNRWFPYEATETQSLDKKAVLAAGASTPCFLATGFLSTAYAQTPELGLGLGFRIWGSRVWEIGSHGGGFLEVQGGPGEYAWV